MKALYLLIVTLLVSRASAYYCQPYCNTNTACTVSYDGCSNPCQAPYSWSSPRGCTLNTTLNTLITAELPSDSAFTSSGFTSNVAFGSTSCSDGNTYHMLGPFNVNEYVYKEFTGLGTNHYQIDIFWSYGLFGGWGGEALSAIFTDGNGGVTMQANQGQTCSTTTALAGCSGTIGCFNNKLQSFAHSTDSISVNFSSIGSAMTVAQTWAINNLNIVISICHTICLTCSGPTANECLSCISGLFLRGSTCIITCPLYTIVDTRTCVSGCPTYYFLNTYNNFCQQCPDRCLSCSTGSECYQWEDGAQQQDIIIELLPLWITLAILLFAILALITWKLCWSNKSFYDKMQQQVIDHRHETTKKEINNERVRQRERVKDGNQSYQTMEQRWLNDIDDLHMTRGTMNNNTGIQGIGKSHLN